MYKTVRHGENSLQYKILAQQEEGVTNIRYRKSPRMVTGKLITVIVLLIIGIIASAILVPLILTNDFIALTGTFQKFSVSTLRRSHSGNHVVVIAKKPYGWNAPRSSVPPRQNNSSLSNSSYPKKPTEDPRPLTTTTAEPTTRVKPTEAVKVTILGSKPTSERPTEDKGTYHHTKEVTTERVGVAEGANGGAKDSSKGEEEITQTSPALQRNFQVETTSSTWAPIWFDSVKKWDLGPSDNFIAGMNGVMTNPVSVFGSFLFVVVVVVMFLILKKSLVKRKTSAEKESAETNGHRTRLLKSSGSSDHDEE